MKLKEVKTMIFSEALAARFSSIADVMGRGRRIGVPEPSIENSSVSGVVDCRGESQRTVSSHLMRMFASRIKPIMPSPKGTVFMESWADVDFAIDVLLRLETQLASVNLQAGIMEAELDNLSKAVLETGRTGDGHITPGGIFNDADIGMPGLTHFADWLMKQGEIPSDWELDLNVVKNTSHGWPSYVPGSDPASNVDLLAHIFLAGMLSHNGGDIDEMARQFRFEVGRVGSPVSALMFFRSGPNKKPFSHYHLSPDGPIELGTSIGLFGRERQVFAVPTFINLYMRAAATRVKHMLRLNHSFKHGTAQDLLDYILANPEFDWISEDISGYDRSVTYQMQMDLADQVYSRFCTPQELSCYKRHQALDVLAPSLTSGDEGFLYKRKGMTISGSIWTDKDGSILNGPGRIANGLEAALGIPIHEIWNFKGVTWDFKVLGDDCIIGVKGGWTPDRRAKYKFRSQQLGFKTDLFDGIVFLMNAVDKERRKTFGIISRAVSKTFFRERESRSMHVDLFGLYFRWVRCQDHPLFDWAWTNAIRRSPAGVRLGLSTFDRLFRLINDPGFVRTMLAEAASVGNKQAMKDLLTGIGHGEFEDAFPLLPSVFQFYGHDLKSAFLENIKHDLLGDNLTRLFKLGTTTWYPYFKRRIEGVPINLDDITKTMKHE